MRLTDGDIRAGRAKYETERQLLCERHERQGHLSTGCSLVELAVASRGLQVAPSAASVGYGGDVLAANPSL